MPRATVASETQWLEVAPVSLPRRTQYFRVTAHAPDFPGPSAGRIVAQVGGGTAIAEVHITVVQKIEAES